MQSRLLIRMILAVIVTVTAQGDPAEQIWNISLSGPSLLKVTPISDNVTDTVIFLVYPGTDLGTLAPSFALADDLTATPVCSTTVDLQTPVKHTLSSSNGSVVATREMSAVHMGSPALQGLYADPNIVGFGNTYYIYSTTDGSAEPILILNGTSGNVPWADRNAWAPTIVERYGKYCLYFSGDNPTYDRKAIGVESADPLEGPFTAEPEAMTAIDPTAFIDPKTGTHYLFWGNGGALMAELADDVISLKNGTAKKVTGLTNFTEASFVVYRAPSYHYTYSNGDTNDADYYVGYATAENVTGPWTYRGVVLHEDPMKGILATGSSSTLHVPGTDDWYMAYHRFAIPNGNGTDREVRLDRVHFDAETGIMEAVQPTLHGILLPEVVPRGAV